MHHSEIENERLGDRIRRLRKERKISQAKLAEMCEVTMSWISQVETGKENASPILLNKIATAFKIPVHELLQHEDQRMELVSRIKLVEVLLETNQPADAESYIVELEHHEGLSEHEKLILTIYLAESKYQQNNFEETLQMLHPMIESLETKNFHDAETLARIRNLIGNAYQQLKDYTRAFYNYQKAYDYTVRFDTYSALSAKISYNLAISLMVNGKSEESLFHLEQSATYFQNTGNLRRLCQVLYEQGLVYKDLKHFEKATQLFMQAKAIMETYNLKNFALIVQQTMAIEITAQSDPELAVQQIQECADSFLAEKEHLLALLMIARIASIHISKNELAEAQEKLEQGNNMFKSNSIDPNTAEVAEFYRVYGKLHFLLEDYPLSIYFSSRSAETFGKIGLVKDQISTLRIMVDAYHRLGDVESAFRFERQRCYLYSQLYGGSET